MVYYSLETSKYKYVFNDLVFVFSSKVSLNKFMNLFKSTLIERTNKINSFYQTTGNYDYMILLNLYKRIEKRGFLVFYKGKELKDYSFSINLIC